MLGSERSLSAAASFCEGVMALKETAEREREADAHADSLRKRRPGEEMPFRTPSSSAKWEGHLATKTIERSQYPRALYKLRCHA
ncbi:unnamed protein product [Euphydryas editha]|uniref:Uncharacterized protein n=1 Tax=Euphydryas editha TaxID=104508 RepID=A0AAU9U7E5_EUPED|nr:unnamed protein product [Euphydryas editha]